MGEVLFLHLLASSNRKDEVNASRITEESRI